MIRVYSKPNCPYCVRTKALLETKGIAYQETAIGVEIDRDTLLEQFPEARTAPIITVDGMFIGGFNELSEYLIETTDQTGQLLCG